MQQVLKALHHADYDTAFELLVRTMTLSTRNEEVREAGLWLAEVYSLYGVDGLEGAYRALEAAFEADPEVQHTELYRALLIELKAVEGEASPSVVLEEFRDPRACYHLAQALVYLGRLEEALALLEAPERLPAFLEWRAWALKGKAYETLGMPREAAEAYRAAARVAVGLERYWNLLDAAAMYVEDGQAEAALQALAEARDAVGEEAPEDAATRHYLTARAELLRGNPTLALEEIQRAEALENEAAEPTHGTPLVKGQVLMALERYAEARTAYEEAVRRAEGSERTYALHELAVATLEAGDLLEAESLLREVIADEEYEYRAQATGDLAEVLYRLGRYDEAGQAAREAIERGAPEIGHLILGNIAYDVMHLEEALEHYREAVRWAPEGSRDWVVAQEMAVDTLVQLGYPEPQEVLERVQATLPYLAPSDEWRDTLEMYAARARALLGGNRTLN